MSPAPAPSPAPARPSAPAAATHDAEPPTPLAPVPEKIGEGPGNLKAREAAFKRRTGLR